MIARLGRNTVQVRDGLYLLVMMSSPWLLTSDCCTVLVWIALQFQTCTNGSKIKKRYVNKQKNDEIMGDYVIKSMRVLQPR